MLTPSSNHWINIGLPKPQITQEFGGSEFQDWRMRHKTLA